LADLQSLFQSEAGGHDIVIDLKEVKLVDRDAVFCLEGWETAGLRLENCPAYIREWINAERSRRSQQLR